MNRLILLLKTNLRLILMLALIVLVTLALGINSIIHLNEFDKESEVLYEKHLVGLLHVKDVNVNLVLMDQSLRQMATAPNALSRASARALLKKAETDALNGIDEARQRILLEANKKLLADFEKQFVIYRTNVATAVLLIEKEGFKSGDATAFISSKEFMDVGYNADAILDSLVASKGRNAKEEVEEAAKRHKLINLATLILLIGGVTTEIFIFTRLLRSVSTMDEERWVKANVFEISASILQLASYDELAKVFLSGIAPLLQVGQGVFYLYNKDEQALKLIAGYGYRERKSLNQSIKAGEGLVGQCFLEKEPITLTNPPTDYMSIGSGLGEAVPKCIAVMPVMQLDSVVAVIELAAFKRFSARETALLDTLLPVLAVRLQMLEKASTPSNCSLPRSSRLSGWSHKQRSLKCSRSRWRRSKLNYNSLRPGSVASSSLRPTACW